MNLTPNYLVVSKIINRITVEKNRIWRFLPIKYFISLMTRSIIRKTDIEAHKHKFTSLLGNFEQFQYYCSDVEKKNQIIKYADQIMEHQFDYLGSGLTNLNPIDWHVDFKSGFRWPKGRFYKKYLTTDFSNNADVKVPWELSRCHHLLWLGEAYLITKDEKYAKEVVVQIVNWIEENPVMYSINWTCAMEVAIRAVNWMYAVNMIISSPLAIDLLFGKLSRSLYEHGFFIYNNLEKGFPYSANHYASDLTGLLFMGKFFNDTNSGKKWLDFALKEFYTEVRQQILPSGVHYERSTSYHRLMSELFFYSYLMLKRTGENIPFDIIPRIKKMVEFIVYYIKPNGLSPLIGDNDNGRLLPFENIDFRDHRYLPGILSILYPGNLFEKYTGFGKIDAFFLLNEQNAKTPTIPEYNATAMHSIIYPDAGFAILRSGEAQLFFNNSGLSRYTNNNRKVFGTHTHSDLLSFELSIGNDDILIDPGSFVYTASTEERNNFRSTKKHNTIVIGNVDQYNLLPDDIFSVSGNVYPETILYSFTKDYDECEGEYCKLDSNELKIIHKRRIQLFKGIKKIIIHDSVQYQGEHELSIYFHLAPEVIVKQDLNQIQLVTQNEISLDLCLASEKNFEIEIFKDKVSPSYGIIEDSMTIKYKSLFMSAIELQTTITWNQKERN